MRPLKISLITVTYNVADTLINCIDSVAAQEYPYLEYIIIDGGSTDGTLSIIDKYKSIVDIVISEPDKGSYDALNKGIKMATGDVVGTLNADDYFADNNILKAIANAFISSTADIVYGDLDYVNVSGEVVRKWRSGLYKDGIFNFGWMPPHPTFYVSRKLFDSYGVYKLNYGTAADYELMLRFMHNHRLKVVYINKVLVKMLTGGKVIESYLNV